MNEEIDDYSIYHQDFTTASEWEVFIARIEEYIHEWEISESKINCKSTAYTKKWLEKSEDISFQDLSFRLSYHYLEVTENDGNTDSNVVTMIIGDEVKSNLWESCNHFLDDSDGSPFPVSQWFSLKQYLMLFCDKPLVDPSLIKLFMSSIHIAFANSHCAVPFFLKIRELWQPTYLGFYENSQFRINYDTIHLKHISPKCSNLTELENLFKSKIASPIPLNSIIISAKYSYELKDLDAFAWKNTSITNELLFIEGFDVQKLTKLPFGTDKNPIKNAFLNAIWPNFREHILVESLNYSEMDPIMAPVWTITLKMREDISCLMSEIIKKVMDLLHNNSLLMDTLGLSRSLGLLNPLHKITEAPITISKLVKAAIGQGTKVSNFKGPISDDLLMPLLYFIFPDAIETSSNKYPEILEENIKVDDQKLCGYVKASPRGGLVWRLSVTAAMLLDVGGLPYLAHLWYEFTQELLYRWEHRILVPGVADGIPNARTCLLHQKLQLLNCCIQRITMDSTGIVTYSSEDEFFDCSEGEDSNELISLMPWDKPVGRFKRLEGATLKNGAPLYIPYTQDSPPKTEDQLEEDAELMVRLGDNARASELRAKMMSASLLSDMEAFKAANPGSELCDFVQWYSPRDWKPDNGGTLGDRMLLPGNPWIETWNVARPVPAAKQRRLFDENRVAEQVLHYLRSRTVEDVAELLLPALLRAAAEKAQSEGAPVTNTTVSGINKRRTFEIAARELCDAEKEVCRSSIARTILNDSVEGEPLDAEKRDRILNLSGEGLPPSTRKEFTLRVKDKVGPQMMRVALESDLFLVGAFTENIVCL